MGQELISAGLAQGKLTLKGEIEEINRLHVEATNFAKTGLQKAREIGERLVAVKEAVKRGAFEALVNETCDFGVRQARTYMRIYNEWDDLIEEFGPGQMSIISLENGIAKLTQSKKEKKAELAAHTLPVANPPPARADEGPCFKGGEHEWERDHELSGEYCHKCHEARPAGRKAHDQDGSRHSEPQGRKPEAAADAGLAPRKLGGDSLDRLVQLLKEAVDLADQAYQESPSPLRNSILDSLNVAYEDALKWRKLG